MQQQEIFDYLIRYFQANKCDIVEKRDGFFSVQLTVEMDKELMNRPFYWHYTEKIGAKPAPMMLTFVTASHPEITGEKIHFGSPRLHQIFGSLRHLAGFIRLYENVFHDGYHQIPLHPWLALNIKVSYKCDRKKDSLHSFGLNLINGTIIEHFHNKLQNLELTPKIPDYSFTISPLIKPKSGISRIMNYIVSLVEKDDHCWAEEARKRWEDDIKLLDHFYEEIDEKPDIYYIEQEALTHLYEPKVIIEIINGGIFYLRENATLQHHIQ